MKDRLSTCPLLVRKMCFSFNAWITGSGADQTRDPLTMRDWDVVISFNAWKEASAFIPTDAVPNTYGGWKCISDEVSVDIWPDDLSKLILHHQTKFLWHPLSGLYIKIRE